MRCDDCQFSDVSQRSRGPIIYRLVVFAILREKIKKIIAYRLRTGADRPFSRLTLIANRSIETHRYAQQIVVKYPAVYGG